MRPEYLDRCAPPDPKIEALIASLKRAQHSNGRAKKALRMCRATWNIARFHDLPHTTSAHSALSVFFRTLIKPA